MKYIKVDWIHNHPTEPILLYSELDDLNWEMRKVNVFSSGNMEYADKTVAIGSTNLSIEAIPPLGEIALDPQFRPNEITKEEFEEVWSRAIRLKGSK